MCRLRISYCPADKPGEQLIYDIMILSWDFYTFEDNYIDIIRSLNPWLKVNKFFDNFYLDTG